MTMPLLCFGLFSISVIGIAESVPQKMELADAIAKRQEEIKTTEAEIQKLETNREALLKESKEIQTQIKRRGLKDEAKASTRALETTREMYAKTREYNNLQQTLENEETKAFTDWCIDKGKWLVGEKTRQAWDATPEAKKLKQEHQQKLDGSYGKWKSEMDELAKKGSKGFGIDDSVIEEQDQRQKDNLEAFRKNDERLDELKNKLKKLKEMTDKDYQREEEKPKETEDEDAKPDHEFFFFATAERMDRDTHLKKNEMKNVQLSLVGGAPPYTLSTSSINSEDNRTITIEKRPSMGDHVSFPVTFSTAGTRSMEFTCVDSEGKCKSVTIVFYVEDEEAEEKKEEAKEPSKEDEDFNKVLEQARTFINKGRTSEAAAQGVITKITAALNEAQQAEVKMNESASIFKLISQKINQMNQLGSQASNLAPAVLNMGIPGEAVVKSAYEDVRQARDMACDIAENIKNSPTPKEDAQRAVQAADNAERGATKIKGEGVAATSVISSAKASLASIQGLRSQAQDLEVEIAGLRTQVSDLPGIIAAASAQVSAVSGSGGEIPKFVAEVESAKSSALGILNLYTSRSEAQILIGQANTLGSSLKSEKGGETLIQEAAAIVARLQAGASGSISDALPAFPVDMAPLEDKIQDLRATADTIELFESQCESTAGAARACANRALSGPQRVPLEPQNSEEPVETPPPPPSWWSPMGESVSGPSVPNTESQKASKESANKQIEQNHPPQAPQQPQGPEGHHQPQGQGSGPAPSQHYPGDGDGC